MNNEPQMELTTAVKPVLVPKPAMPHPCPPPDLTAAAIASAKGAELQHWINQANWQAAGGKQVLKKAGCINELQEWLAQYYGLKLNGSPAKTGLQATASDAPPPAAHSPSGNHVPAINADISSVNGSTWLPSVMNGPLQGILSSSVNNQVSFPTYL